MNSSSDDSIDDLFNSHLKSVSLNEIEVAIATCLGKLVDDTYSIRITSLEFDSMLGQNAKMMLKIDRKISQ